MSKRLLLRKQFSDAWRTVIQGPYTEGLVNSERGLQVHYCIALLKQFHESKVLRRLFIEPAIRFENEAARYPDLVVCNTKSVIGVVEFKYTPRGIPNCLKDMTTLEMLASLKNSVEISNDRFRGKSRTIRRYSVSEDAVLCWAGVYTGDCITLPKQAVRRIGPRLLQLDARTSSGNDPILNCAEPFTGID